MHEASCWPTSCFVTLTYAPGNLPPGESLCHRDYQLFMKRLRKRYRKTIRFYMSGEYGDTFGRPHYHACLFNVDFRSDSVPAGKSGSGHVYYSSPSLDALWKLGNCSVQPLTQETAGYCARYVMQKLTGDQAEAAYALAEPVTDEETGEILTHKVAPYNCMSLRPGIGDAWLSKYAGDVYPRDYVVADGMKFRPPAFYDRLMERRSREGDPARRLQLDEIDHARELRAKASASDQTDERRAVREIVHKARVRNQKRDLL